MQSTPFVFVTVGMPAVQRFSIHNYSQCLRKGIHPKGHTLSLLNRKFLDAQAHLWVVSNKKLKNNFWPKKKKKKNNKKRSC